MVICTSVNEIQSKARFFNQLFQRLKDNNIKLTIGLSGEEKEVKKINTKFKIKAKQLNIDARFYISDSKEVLFMISKGDQPEEEIAIWLNTPFFANSLCFMFNQALKE